MFRFSQESQSSTSKLQEQLDRELRQQSRQSVETLETFAGNVLPPQFDLKLGQPFASKPDQQQFWN